MTFSYVGYIWAIAGCACLGFFIGGVALTLTLIGRRVDRGSPVPTVESLPVREQASRAPGPDGPGGEAS